MAADFRECLERGADEFNRALFFEAHETWEAAWRAQSGEPAYFLQGLIQVAAAFVKVQRKMPRGALALFDRAVERLSAFPPDAYGVSLAALLAEVAPWRAAVSEASATQGPIPAALPFPYLVVHPPAGVDSANRPTKS
jgi:predicted metal-dependent hydrolase